MARVRRLTLALIVLAGLPAPAAAALPVVHADRGAHTAYGRPELGEDTLPAFRAAFHAWGAVVEVDATLTGDGVPVAMHDATLDRTTSCTGLVAGRTLAELAVCRVDTVGSPGGPLGGAAAACPEAIPTIAEVLADARDAGATVDLDIAAEPGAPGLAAKVMDVVVTTGMPKARLILQSSSPADLDLAKARLPGVPTSLVTLQAANADGPATASSQGYEWVAPEWPVDAAYVNAAHALGRKVVPYRLDDAGQVQAAAALGADALITDDAGMARRALGLADGSDPGGLTCPAPPQALPVALGPPVTRILVPALASDAFTSPHLRLRWRGRGADDDRADAFVAEVRPAASHRAADWRALVADAPLRNTLYTATPGSTFVLRVAARDASGRFGPAAVRAVTVPLDDASRRVRRSGRWRRARSRGAWRGRVSASASRRAKLALRFTGRRLRVVARRSARAGRLAVTIDGRRRVVATAGATAPRVAVFDSGRLRSGRHRVVLRPAGGGRVEIDAIAPS
jgi:glycerophosphoryl diester phosphodiesterase